MGKKSYANFCKGFQNTHTHTQTPQIKLEPKKLEIWNFEVSLPFIYFLFIYFFFFKKFDFFIYWQLFCWRQHFFAEVAKIGHFRSKYNKKTIENTCRGAIFSKLPVTLLKMALHFKCFYSVKSMYKSVKSGFLVKLLVACDFTKTLKTRVEEYCL